MTSIELRKALIDLGMQQDTFAELLRRNVGTVSRWARGEVAIPHYVEIIVGLLRYKASMERSSAS